MTSLQADNTQAATTTTATTTIIDNETNKNDDANNNNKVDDNIDNDEQHEQEVIIEQQQDDDNIDDSNDNNNNNNDNNDNDDDTDHIIGMINYGISRLDTSNRRISDHGVIKLVKTFQKNYRLYDLRFYNVTLSLNGWQLLAQGFRTDHQSKLQTFFARDCNITPDKINTFVTTTLYNNQSTIYIE
jgi:hypothetical protein